jgi:hypothetical protein
MACPIFLHRPDSPRFAQASNCRDALSPKGSVLDACHVTRARYAGHGGLWASGTEYSILVRWYSVRHLESYKLVLTILHFGLDDGRRNAFAVPRSGRPPLWLKLKLAKRGHDWMVLGTFSGLNSHLGCAFCGWMGEVYLAVVVLAVCEFSSLCVCTCRVVPCTRRSSEVECMLLRGSSLDCPRVWRVSSC